MPPKRTRDRAPGRRSGIQALGPRPLNGGSVRLRCELTKPPDLSGEARRSRINLCQAPTLTDWRESAGGVAGRLKRYATYPVARVLAAPLIIACPGQFDKPIDALRICQRIARGHRLDWISQEQLLYR